MSPTFVAEGREPSGLPPQSPTFTGRLAPLRYKEDNYLGFIVGVIGLAPFRFQS